MASEVRVRRIYEEPDPGDGRRVLVDRLWPRGVAKADARLDEWAKDAAPSPELRAWFAHRGEVFAEFAERYRAELERPPAADAVHRLSAYAEAGPLVLLTATRDVERSSAAVLADVLRG